MKFSDGSTPTAVSVRFQAAWTATADIVWVRSHISKTALGSSVTAIRTASSTVPSGCGQTVAATTTKRDESHDYLV